MIQSIRGIQLFSVLMVLYLSSTSGWLLMRPIMHNACSKLAVIRQKRQISNMRLQCISDGSPESDLPTDEEAENIEVAEDADENSKSAGVEEIFIEEEGENAAPEKTEPEDPETIARKKFEEQLQSELSKAEILLRNERIQLSKTRDKISESGKNGFFLVKAKVNDFLRSKEAQEKELIAQKRREVVLKLLPILDKFRTIAQEIPAETKRETNMHDSFNACLKSILIVIQRYGYEETEAAPGDTVDLSKHEIIGSEESDHEGVISTVRKGMLDNRGIVLRKAQVIVGKKAKPVPVESESVEQAENQERDE
jgi:molecular chaperone GrpE